MTEARTWVQTRGHSTIHCEGFYTCGQLLMTDNLTERRDALKYVNNKGRILRAGYKAFLERI